jgi:hypothetical protein
VIVLDNDKALADLIDRIADRVVAKLQNGSGAGSETIAYREPQAAQLLGIPQHRLKAARLRGDIKASRVGRAFLYTRRALLALAQREDD